MKEFPKLKENQTAILRAEVSTGHILDESFDIVVDNKQNVFTIFESVVEALHFSKKLMAERPDIEIVIYGSKEQVLHFLNPTKTDIQNGN